MGLGMFQGDRTIQNNMHFSRTMLDLCTLDKPKKLCYAGDQHKPKKPRKERANALLQ